MSILGSIFSKILGHHDTPAAAPAGAAPAPTPASTKTPTPAPGTGTTASSAPSPSTPAPSSTTAPTAAPSPSSSAPAGGAAAPAGAPAQTVDVAAMLDGLAKQNSQTLDWKHSIVDMMKLLNLDSSLQARQELAKELNYTGDMHDSATMNVWLHKQVMSKLAENGGKVPDDLRH